MGESDSLDVNIAQQRKIIKESGWPVKYGGSIMVVSGLITGNIFNYHYRKIYRMGKAFRMTTWIPVAVICPLIGGLMHAAEVNKLITRNKLQLECPICYQLKSGMIQLTVGGVYPLLTAFVFCTGLVKKYKPENLQKIGMLQTTSKLAQFKMVLPTNVALSLLLGNFAIGAVVALLQLRSLIDQMKESAIEKDSEN